MNHKTILSKDLTIFSLMAMVLFGSLYSFHTTNEIGAIKDTIKQMNQRIEYQNKVVQDLSDKLNK